ncbi:MAG: glycosyltransferase [Planctomycetes bacterium]|nr:glycosyltransferase [Planctomycetota bacterium]
MTAPTDSRGNPRLAVAMIVRNEEDVLAGSLQSVARLADEIVVLDTGSTDRTVEVARGFGATVHTIPWSDDFSAARNACLDRVTADWVLWLDAGEQLTAASASELRRFVDGQADRAKVYALMIEIPPADPSASAEQIALPRLMPKLDGLRFTGRVRETLSAAMETLGLELDAMPGRIVRHPRHNDSKFKAVRARRNLELVAQEVAETGWQPVLLLAHGEACVDVGDNARAATAFREAVGNCPRGSTDMLEAYYGLLTALDGDATRRDEQLSVALEALDVFPLDAQLLCAMGHYLQSRERMDLAERSFGAAVEHGQVDLQTWHLCEISEIAAVCLGLTHQLQQRDAEALATLEDALGRFEHSTRLRRQLIDLYVKHGRQDDARRAAEGLTLASNERDLLVRAVGAACRATADDWTPALEGLQSAYDAGCRDPMCLRWLSVALLSGGKTTAAMPVLNQWHELEPNNGEVKIYLDALAADGQEKPAADVRTLRVDPPVASPLLPTPTTTVSQSMADSGV